MSNFVWMSRHWNGCLSPSSLPPRCFLSIRDLYQGSPPARSQSELSTDKVSARARLCLCWRARLHLPSPSPTSHPPFLSVVGRVSFVIPLYWQDPIRPSSPCCLCSSPLLARSLSPPFLPLHIVVACEEGREGVLAVGCREEEYGCSPSAEGNKSSGAL
jgi:hypothetical protein